MELLLLEDILLQVGPDMGVVGIALLIFLRLKKELEERRVCSVQLMGSIANLVKLTEKLNANIESINKEFEIDSS